MSFMEPDHTIRNDLLSSDELQRVVSSIQTAGFRVADSTVPGSNAQKSFVAKRVPGSGSTRDPITWAESIRISQDGSFVTLTAHFPGWWQQPLIGCLAGFAGLCMYPLYRGDTINWQILTFSAIIAFLAVTVGRAIVWRDYQPQTMNRLRLILESAKQNA
jgi:hypothetical protein